MASLSTAAGVLATIASSVGTAPAQADPTWDAMETSSGELWRETGQVEVAARDAETDPKINLASNPKKAAEQATILRSMLSTNAEGEYLVDDAQLAEAKRTLSSALQLTQHGLAESIKLAPETYGRHLLLSLTFADGFQTRVELNADDNTLRVLNDKEQATLESRDAIIRILNDDSSPVLSERDRERRVDPWNARTNRSVLGDWDKPVEHKGPTEEHKKIVNERIREALGIAPEAKLDIDARENRAGLSLSVNVDGKRIIDTHFRGNKADYFLDYRSSETQLEAGDPRLAVDSLPGATVEDVKQRTVDLLHRVRGTLACWDGYSGKRPEPETKFAVEQAVRKSLDIPADAELQIRGYGGKVVITASRGLEMVTHAKYDLGAASLSDFHHSAHSGFQRPIEWSPGPGQSRGTTLELPPSAPLSSPLSPETLRVRENIAGFISRNYDRLGDYSQLLPEVTERLQDELKAALDLPSEQYLVISSFERDGQLRFNVSMNSRVLIESDYQKSDSSFAAFREYRTADLDTAPQALGLPDYRAQGPRNRDEIVQDTIQAMNALSKYLSRWDDSAPGVALSPEAKFQVKEILKGALDLPQTASLDIEAKWGGVKLLASDGLKLLATGNYTLGERKVSEFYHSASAGYERPIPWYPAPEVKQIVMPQVVPAAAEPGMASIALAPDPNRQGEVFKFKNPDPRVGPPIAEIRIGTPELSRDGLQTTVLPFATILENGVVNDAGYIEYDEGGRAKSATLTVVNQVRDSHKRIEFTKSVVPLAFEPRVMRDPNGSKSAKEPAAFYIELEPGSPQAQVRFMNPPRSVGGAISEITLGKPELDEDGQRTIVRFQAKLTDGTVNDAGFISYNSDGKPDSYTFTLSDQKSTWGRETIER